MREKSELCSVDELKLLIRQNKVNVLDSSWYLPSQCVDCLSEFEKGHIPGAQFFDIDVISDQQSNLPHMLPKAKQFSSQVSALGISNNSHIVVYDSAGLFAAARAWWTFKVFGHDNVRVLDGGLPAWVKENGELEQQTRSTQTTNYTAEINSNLIADKATLIKNISSKHYAVLDARPTERFLGTAPEPRPGLPSGHMPESISLSATSLVSQGRLQSRNELQRMFSKININPSTPLITSCGSGVTAAIITLALAESGFGLNKLYDGSWAEWASADDTLILNKSI